MEYATLFPLDRICGRWKSRGKSPPVRVYREGHTYRIALAYRWGAVLTATLYRNGQGTWAELPERVGGMGTKAHDLFVLPLCRKHHDELHADTAAFEEKYGSQLELIFRFIDRALATGVLA